MGGAAMPGLSVLGANAMGGGIQEAYEEMKYEGSFEIYLTSYDAPFVFLNPYEDISDFLSFAHEFGHFYQ